MRFMTVASWLGRKGVSAVNFREKPEDQDHGWMDDGCLVLLALGGLLPVPRVYCSCCSCYALSPCLPTQSYIQEDYSPR